MEGNKSHNIMRFAPPENVFKKIEFFFTDVMKMGYSEEEIFAVLHESERD